MSIYAACVSLVTSPRRQYIMFGGAFGGGAAAVPAVEPQSSCTSSAGKDDTNKDSRNSLYTFDEPKLESIRKTKPWIQE